MQDKKLNLTNFISRVMSASASDSKSMAVLVRKESEEKLDDLEETRRALERAESRARLSRKRKDQKVPLRRNDREFAEALHREADQLYHSGDYELALVLYHRAASVYPRDSSHVEAANRTTATINSWNKSSKSQKKLLPNVESKTKFTGNLCPETAAIRSSNTLKISPTFQSVSEVLSILDNHKEFWRKMPSPGRRNDGLKQSRGMLRQLNSLTSLSLKKLEATFNSGKMTVALKIAEELLTLSSGLAESHQHQIAAYHYLSLIHVSLGRHDRAVNNVTRMIRLTKSKNDPALFCRSLVTLGKVHLAFGHLEAAARAWQYLAGKLTEPIPQAWIYHEIGRCYLETGKYREAIQVGMKCTQIATEANSKKWMLYGNLLLGQSLAKLGRFAEALEQLEIVSKITKHEGDSEMMKYVEDLQEQVKQALRKIVFYQNGQWREEKMNLLKGGVESLGRNEDLNGLSSTFGFKDNQFMTTVFSRKKGLPGAQDGSSSSEELANASGEITMRLTSTESLVEASYRGNQDEKDDLQRRTFRVNSPIGLSIKNAPFSSSSSIRNAPSIGSNVLKDFLRFAEEDFENYPETTLMDVSRTRSSSTSLKSGNTNLTYIVVDEKKKKESSEEVRRNPSLCNEIDQCSGKEEPRANDEGLNKEVRMLFQKYSISSGDPGDKGSCASTLNVLEELDKKNEEELLEILKELLLDEESSQLFEEFQSQSNVAAIPPKDKASRMSRSSEDSSARILANKALYRHSLPTSPRKCDPDIVSYTFRKGMTSLPDTE